MKNYTPQQIVYAMASKGYAVFDDNSKPYNLNIFGVRSGDGLSNRFDDVIGVFYPSVDGDWVCFQFPATTDPGVYWRAHPINVRGTAILKPGQYRGSHKLGDHKGYPALQQRKPVTVYRDANKDEVLDFDAPTEAGMFGINIHRASHRGAVLDVNKWSAGCQVIQDPLHFDFLLSLCRESVKFWGNAFTYTLLTEGEV